MLNETRALESAFSGVDMLPAPPAGQVWLAPKLRRIRIGSAAVSGGIGAGFDPVVDDEAIIEDA